MSDVIDVLNIVTKLKNTDENVECFSTWLSWSNFKNKVVMFHLIVDTVVHGYRLQGNFGCQKLANPLFVDKKGTMNMANMPYLCVCEWKQSWDVRAEVTNNLKDLLWRQKLEWSDEN